MASEPKVRRNTGNAGKGRPKGAPNKMTKQLKEMILSALDRAGGESYLVRQADENPTAFLTLIGKVLPLQLAGDPDGDPIKTLHRIELIGVSPRGDSQA